MVITKKTVWNTRIKHYQKEHESSHKDKSRLYILDRMRQKDIGSILELGVGSGILLDNMRACGLTSIKYSGIDASKEFIRVTKKKYPKMHIVEHDFDQTLPFPDFSYDITYARHVIEHCKHYKPVIREMARVAIKEVIVITFRPFEENDKIDFRKHKGTYYNSYSEKNVRVLCDELFSKYDIIELGGNKVGPSHQGKNWIIHGLK